VRIGCHVSIAGGIVNAPKRAADLGCEVFQMFSRSPQGGPAPKLTAEIVKEFKTEMEKHAQKNCYIHAPYYINFASSKKAICSSSVRIVREELERGSLIGAKYVMFHPGSAKDLEREEALKITARGVAQVLKGYKGTTELLLEISAGAGRRHAEAGSGLAEAGGIIGDTFDELANIIKACGKKPGICLDSAHMFASGYDIKTKDGFAGILKTIKETVGMDSVKLIHANDSKVGLGERKDRHEHIGDGKIGVEGFKNLINSFSETDFILETQHDKVVEDIKLLKGIRGLLPNTLSLRNCHTSIEAKKKL